MRIQSIGTAIGACALLATHMVAGEANAQQTQQQQQQQPQQQMRQQQNKGDMSQRLQARQPPQQVRGQRPIQMVLVTEAERITSSPAQFYGVPVSVHAQVEEVTSPNAFQIGSGDWWDWGGSLTVIVPKPVSRTARVNQNDYVTVVGTVRRFIRAEIERDYDWFNDLPDINIELEGRPVLIADVARTSDGVNLATSSQQVTRVFVADAGDIADVPGRFYGRTVSVRAEVEDVVSPRAFTLDEEEWFAGPDVLVLNPFPATGVSGNLAGQNITVVGTVRPFVQAEFEQDYDWFNIGDYQGFNLTDWNMRPVIVASSIVGAANNAELVQFQPVLVLDTAETRTAKRADQWPRMAEARRAQQQRQQGPTGATGTAGQQQPAGTTGRPQTQQPQQGQKDDLNPITDWNALASGQMDRLMNQPVRLERTQVLRVIDNRTYLIGPSQDQAVMVRLQQAPAQTIQANQWVRLMGIVQQTPADAPFRDRPYYINATMLSPVQ